MKITIKDKKINVTPEYPCLKCSEFDNAIVFFSSPNTGVVIRGTKYKVGDYRNDWHMAAFVKFSGTVELSNEQ